MNFYNDNDLKICAWLRELIKQKLIPYGVVDSRPIELIQPDELKPYIQCHFFAGIGGWPEALRLAGWPVDAPVWTGSCPCQPYSCAGKGKGDDDPRNVWPHFRRLIEAGHPPVVFGEQVASKAGREWLSGVFADLEALDYSRAGADLCAAGVGAPHIRQRLYWLADAASIRRERWWSAKTATLQGGCAEREGQHKEPKHAGKLSGRPEGLCSNGGVADTDSRRCNASGELGGLSEVCAGRENQRLPAKVAGSVSDAIGLGNTNEPRSQGFNIGRDSANERIARSSSVAGQAWSNSELIPCRDGKSRRVESGTFPLAHGIPARVVRLRGYGNAIVPQVAAEFIGAYMDINPLPL